MLLGGNFHNFLLIWIQTNGEILEKKLKIFGVKLPGIILYFQVTNLNTNNLHTII